MTFSECLETYKTSDCYGPFCSIVACGKYSDCTNTKCSNNYWYPDKIKDSIEHTKRRGIKTCDILTYNSNGIYIMELKPDSHYGTEDVFSKIKGTYKLFTIIYPQFGETELHQLKAFLIRCNPKWNQKLMDALSYLSTPKSVEQASFYKKNEIVIQDIVIPVHYFYCNTFMAIGMEANL